VSLQKAMMTLQRMNEQIDGKDAPKEKKGELAVKSETVDPSSYVGALNQVLACAFASRLCSILSCPPQLYDAGLVTVTFPSNVSHASDVQAPVMFANLIPALSKNNLQRMLQVRQARGQSTAGFYDCARSHVPIFSVISC
jgi:hypothetical protein